MTASDGNLGTPVPIRARLGTVMGALVATLHPSHLFAYGEPDAVVRIALGRALEATLDGDDIVVRDARAVVRREIAVDPLAQVGRLLGELAPAGWTAYGYLGFDLTRHYYEYRKAAGCAALHLVVPELECTLGGGELRVRGARAPTELAGLANLVDGEPPSPAEIPTDVGARRARYLAHVSEAIGAIRRGELDKVILARTTRVPGRLDLGATLSLAEVTSGARLYGFAFGDVAGAGRPPGVLLEASPDGGIATTVLAGTRSRGETAEADAALTRELFSDPKEVREHAMSVRLALSEVGTVCTPETTAVRDFMSVKAYRLVQHLSSRVTGTLEAGRTVWDAIRAVFPGVSASGIAKAPAIRMINEHEEEARGVYGGAIGWIDHRGAADLSIALRSVFQLGDTVFFNAGAGIVAESSPEAEFTESENKMKTMRTRTVLRK